MSCDPNARPPTHHPQTQGPTLTPGELCQEMVRRRAEVLREKEQEKAKARAEKIKQVCVCGWLSVDGCV